MIGFTNEEWTLRRALINGFTEKDDGEHTFADVINLRDEANELRLHLIALIGDVTSLEHSPHDWSEQVVVNRALAFLELMQ